MKNRADRLFIKAQIRKRLIEKAIREYNRRQAGRRRDGEYIALVRTKEELSNTGYTSLGRVLRNEGKNRKRIYPCCSSFCDWCIGNLTRKNRRRDAAMTADFATWLTEGDAGNDDDEAWERDLRWRLSVAEALMLNFLHFVCLI